jgi:hypothetical protein
VTDIVAMTGGVAILVEMDQPDLVAGRFIRGPMDRTGRAHCSERPDNLPVQRAAGCDRYAYRSACAAMAALSCPGQHKCLGPGELLGGRTERLDVHTTHWAEVAPATVVTGRMTLEAQNNGLD